MFASNLNMYFIVLTTAATLHANGKTGIRSAREAARRSSRWRETPRTGFSLWVLSAPECSACRCWRARPPMPWLKPAPGRDRWKGRRAAAKFYTVLTISLVLGRTLDYAGLDAVKMLFWSAVINGALAPPLILLIILLTSNAEVMGGRVNSPAMKFFGW